ncbi:hypothetical protein LXL04_021168 [Taraxacum kok-saghyz]
MSIKIPPTSQPKEPFHRRNGSDELDVFEAAHYFSGATENFSVACKNVNGDATVLGNNTQKYCMRRMGRMSLDIPKNIENTIPLQAMLMENSMNNEKKSKHPSSPGGRLAHFLNSLFNQTSSKKSQSKSKTKSTKSEDDSPGGWRRKRSSISHFRSGNSNSSISDSKSLYSTSKSSGFRTPPFYHIAHTPTKTGRSYLDLKQPPSQITKIPINGTLKRNESFNIKTDLSENKMSVETRFVENVKMYDEKQEEHHHPRKYVSREDVKGFKRFSDEDGGDSDSSSDLFELTNCDLGYYPSGLPVYETTRVDAIKRGVPI